MRSGWLQRDTVARLVCDSWASCLCCVSTWLCTYPQRRRVSQRGWSAVLECAIGNGQKSYLPSHIRIAGNSSRNWINCRTSFQLYVRPHWPPTLTTNCKSIVHRSSVLLRHRLTRPEVDPSDYDARYPFTLRKYLLTNPVNARYIFLAAHIRISRILPSDKFAEDLTIFLLGHLSLITQWLPRNWRTG